MSNKHYFIAQRREHAEFYVLAKGLSYTDMVHVTNINHVRGLKNINIKVLRNGDQNLVNEILLKCPTSNISMEYVNV